MHGGRVYPSFNVNGTHTGRISSSNPNMQQLPKEGGVRGIYIPDPGYKIISCDYAQLEVVIAAHFSRDPNLLKIVYDGASKHDITNEGLKLRDRNLAKTVNFAMQYLCGWQKIQKLLKCSEADAKGAWSQYWELYKEERKIVDQCIARVNANEPIINPWGRRRRFPDIKSLNHYEREKCYRQAYNALIQGTGSDCTSWACYTANDRLRSKGIGKILFSVHDELLGVSHDTSVEDARSLIANTMVEAGKVINLTINLSVDCSQGMSRWAKG
jgi:DNA polymerase-1